MKKEIWKPIPGYNGKYLVSNLGRIKSLVRKKQIILSQFKDRCGYFVVNLYNKNGQKTTKVHRLVAERFIKNPHRKPCVNHLDCNKENNSSKNLQWCTNQENMDHAYANGLINAPFGEKCHNAKISNDDVKEMRKKYIPFKYTAKMIAEEYGIHHSYVSLILHGRRRVRG